MMSKSKSRFSAAGAPPAIAGAYRFLKAARLSFYRPIVAPSAVALELPFVSPKRPFFAEKPFHLNFGAETVFSKPLPAKTTSEISTIFRGNSRGVYMGGRVWCIQNGVVRSEHR